MAKKEINTPTNSEHIQLFIMGILFIVKSTITDKFSSVLFISMELFERLLNKQHPKKLQNYMPYIFFILDKMADLMGNSNEILRTTT